MPASPWRTLRFDIPAGFRDDTVITLLDEVGGRVVTSVTVVGGPPVTSLDGYVAEQIDEAKKTIAGWRLVTREQREVAGMPAIVVEARAAPRDAGAVHQHQAFVDGSDQLFIITATSAEAHGVRGKASFERLLADLRRT